MDIAQAVDGEDVGDLKLFANHRLDVKRYAPKLKATAPLTNRGKDDILDLGDWNFSGARHVLPGLELLPGRSLARRLVVLGCVLVSAFSVLSVAKFPSFLPGCFVVQFTHPGK